MNVQVKSITPGEAWKIIDKDDTSRFTEEEMNKFHRCVAASTKLEALFIDKKFIAMYGLMPPILLANYAVLWLHWTEAVKDHEFIFVRRSQIAVKNMLKSYNRICGFCEVGADRSIRWLKWLGATFDEPNERMMLPFTIRSK